MAFYVVLFSYTLGWIMIVNVTPWFGHANRHTLRHVMFLHQLILRELYTKTNTSKDSSVKFLGGRTDVAKKNKHLEVGVP